MDIQSEFNKAFKLHQDGELKKALRAYLILMEKLDQNPIYLFALGTLYGELKMYTFAVYYLKKSNRLQPNNSDTLCNIGKFLSDNNQHEEAVLHFENALDISPDSFVTHNNLGNALKALYKYDKASLSYDKAIELNSKYTLAYYNKGILLQGIGCYEEASIYYKKAIELNPEYVEAFYNLGISLYYLNKPKDALECFESAISIKSDFNFLYGYALHLRSILCEWNNTDQLKSYIIKQLEDNKPICTPFHILTATDSLIVHKHAAEVFCEQFTPNKNPRVLKTNFHCPKIRIGYFSADFHNHATMHLISEVFDFHNKDSFEIIAFSFGPDSNDTWRENAKKNFYQFVECKNLTDSEIANLSVRLNVNIAVDLKGFTSDSRIGIFLNRAAPIQINFLGYPGTLGSTIFDYIIADRFVIPENLKEYYSEKIAYLPNCYQPNCRNRQISTHKFNRSDFGLPTNAIVFCSFNSTYKISPIIVNSWGKILNFVKDSVLWIMATNEESKNNLTNYFETIGIDQNRLIFTSVLPIDEHLNRLQFADIMLDTFPCNAHTTCSDALRMGVPVVTLAGESFPSRVAGSLLNTLGLPELIAYSYSDYESLAIDLANNKEKLNSTRSRIKNAFNSSALFDSELFAKNLEILYNKIHKKYLLGLPADHI